MIAVSAAPIVFEGIALRRAIIGEASRPVERVLGVRAEPDQSNVRTRSHVRREI